MNSTPQDEAIMDSLLGKRLLEWEAVEERGVYLTFSDGTVMFCFGVGILIENERTIQ